MVYKKLRASDDFGEYRMLARSLQTLDLNELAPVERKALSSVCGGGGGLGILTVVTLLS